MEENLQLKTRSRYLAVITIILLAVTSIAGVLSLNFHCAGEVTNQYGQAVSIYGYGIYAHDTYFQAPISIGTDFGILFVVIPLFIYSYVKYRKKMDDISELRLLSVYGVSLYYAASISFGLAFNQLFLVYIVLFTCSLFGVFYHVAHIKRNRAVSVGKGINVFLFISGVALLIAWMPDVIPAIIKGTAPASIGIYTTCITYVIDMGVISPLCFFNICLLMKKNPMGTVILAVVLKLCIVVGCMMITQTICQYASGCDLPLAVMLTKSFSFVLLGGFALVFNHKLYEELKRENCILLNTIVY